MPFVLTFLSNDHMRIVRALKYLTVFTDHGLVS